MSSALIHGVPANVFPWLMLSIDASLSRAEKYQLIADDGARNARFKHYQSCALSALHAQVLQKVSAFLKTPRSHCVCLDHCTYPSLLKQLNDPPLLLYALGDLSLFEKPSISVVGSRKPTPLGLRSARDFSRTLANMGLCVVSGMALGIDACAHQASLVGQGGTIAVLASGADVIYPSRHSQLYRSIVENGLVISEYLPGDKARAYRFPERNRIVSGLSLGTLIVEAAERSGTLITARLSLEQNREVFVVPGGLYSTQYAGSNRLIKQGACMVSDVDDILFELSAQLRARTPDAQNSDLAGKARSQTETDALALSKVGLLSNQDCVLVFQELERAPSSVDALVELCGLDAARINSALSLLELEGVVANEAQGRFFVCV